MKRITIFLLILCLGTSCSKNLEALNENTKDATSAGGETFFTSALVNLSNRMNNVGLSQPPFVFFVQYLTEVTYVELSNYYIANTNVSDLLWQDIYQRVIKNLNEAYIVTSTLEPLNDDEQVEKNNRLAITEIMTVFTYGMLVDVYGDIPYSDAMNIDNVLPKYDDAETIYLDLLSRLDAAISQLDPAGTSFGRNDVFYNGDVSKWVKFANSLRLKLGLRLIDAIPEQGKEAVLKSAEHVFTSNDDNAILKYQSTTPNTHPLWVHLVQNNSRFYVGTSTIIDLMNELADPRRSAYFSQVNGSYIGGEYGAVQSFDLSSHLSARFYEPTLEAIITDYASVEFLLAEAIERGILTNLGTTEEHYNKAIEASFEYYEIEGISDYLANPMVNYITAAGDWKQKIGTQKWLALFNQGFEAWSEYRRLDYPVLLAPEDGLVSTVPTRLFYPVSEQGLNRENYEQASAAIGGDELTNRVFWDQN